MERPLSAPELADLLDVLLDCLGGRRRIGAEGSELFFGGGFLGEKDELFGEVLALLGGYLSGWGVLRCSALVELVL